jgi:uncharacterized membrane protein YdcZ (DUF606 family)
VAIWPYLLFGFVAGAMLPIQFGINAQLATWVDNPVRATLISFAVGTAALVVVMLAAYRDWPSSGSIAGAPWWVWVGGLLGAFYVLGSVVAAPLGAATLVAVIPRRTGVRISPGRPLRLGGLRRRTRSRPGACSASRSSWPASRVRFF